jgi:hypothetical protein
MRSLNAPISVCRCSVAARTNLVPSDVELVPSGQRWAQPRRTQVEHGRPLSHLILRLEVHAVGQGRGWMGGMK